MNKDSSESSEPLLPSHDVRSSLLLSKAPRKLLAPNWSIIILLLLVVYLSIIESIQLFWHKVSSPPYSPANTVLRNEQHFLYRTDDTVYRGEPSEELDSAWDELLLALNIRASPEEMALNHENVTNAVRLPDGDYVALLGVYHQLHCLNTLRMIIYSDYYSQHDDDERVRKIDWNPHHTTHCIESIRRSLMCHADVALYGVEWIADSHEAENMRLRSNAEVTCVNWDAVNSWAKERALVRHQYKVAPGPFEQKH